ncbi:hypothetical protein Bca52824_092611 [Brassica carinata]|uniref:SHSP domain-containing protein n=1 Tax=Brassica carinata TaxID=52824 RepID=A0A8X7TF85_BRACI|nr:hypothetical protein Bca52824_092611 [Brassica carinata]
MSYRKISGEKDEREYMGVQESGDSIRKWGLGDKKYVTSGKWVIGKMEREGFLNPFLLNGPKGFDELRAENDDTFVRLDLPGVPECVRA